METEINFKRVRDFGELIQGSFVFARQEFKGLFSLLLIYAGPFVLMYAISSAYYQYEFQNLALDPTNFMNSYFNNPGEVLREFYKPLLLLLLFGVISMVMITGITIGYIKNYVDFGRGNFSKDDVWNTAKQHMGAYIGYTFLYSLAVGFGTLFFIIPGIYFYVAFSLIYVVRTMEGQGVAETFGRSQRLISGYWWYTFGLYFVMSIIISLISSVLGLGQGIISGVQAISGTSSTGLDIAYLVMASLVAFVSYLFYVLLYIAQGLHYFNLIERKESPDLEDRISRIN